MSNVSAKGLFISAIENRATMYTIIIAGALLLFEMFQFSSDYQALQDMIGVSSWSFGIAFGLCAIDFAGLARLRSQSAEREPSYLYLAGAWLLSVVGENFFTYFVVSHSASERISSNVMVSSGFISATVWTVYIPILFSIFTWAVQVLLVSRLERSVDKVNQSRGNNDGIQKSQVKGRR